MSVPLAQELYSQGRYTDALAILAKTVAKTKPDAEERDCLLCECLQFAGEYDQALERAHTALSGSLNATKTARYWGVIGKVCFDRGQRAEAVDAFEKALRAAAKCGDLVVLANIQQLRLVAAGLNLGSGLSSAVREAYLSAVRTADAAILAGFHVRLSQLEGVRGSFAQAFHHLALAKSLLSRSNHIALTATYHVNNACVLSLTGELEAARRSAEAGALLAEQAGYGRLALASANNVAHVAVSTGELSIAETWLRKARELMARLGIEEVGPLESTASAALLRGDIQAARENIATILRLYEKRELSWREGEIHPLLTSLYVHRKVGNLDARGLALIRARAAAEASQDKYSALLVTLAEAEFAFDRAERHNAQAKVRKALAMAPRELLQIGELGRIAARDLWLSDHSLAARRKLLRTSAILTKRSTRLGWSQALCELRAMDEEHPIDAAYSLTDQLRIADAKFAPLMTQQVANWYQPRGTTTTVSRDALDGFDDAIGILELGEDPELCGREALASIIALDVCEAAALIVRRDAGLRIVASHQWSISAIHKSVPQDPATVSITVGKLQTKSYELLLKPKQDLRSLFAISGLRRLLEAAKAMESQQKNQQRLGSLWQPEIIVEEPDAVFSSPQMIELMQTARKVAATTLPVLLLGNTGTGKEVLARAIHRASPRANKVFLPFNCSAVPRDMVESQLFGYRRGSFTGAHADFQGIIRSAEGGTLFLDEIGELSMDLQPKLLRFLETNEVHPLGEGRPIKVDVRVIAATNADLDDLIQLKEFREDLYYRLNIVRFHMPQLCERREEIPALVNHLVRRFEMDEKKHGIKFSDEMLEYLLLYKWPGNIRQLSNELRRMVAMVGSNETLTPDHLGPAIRATRRTIPIDPDAEPDTPAADPAAETPELPNLTLNLDQPLPGAVEALERAMIEHAMTRAGGRLEEAARLLGISRKGLFLKRRRWNTGGETPSNTA